MGGSWSCLSCGSKSAILTSTKPFCNYQHTILECLEGQSSTRTIEEQIEHSKTHWSQVADFELDVDEVAEESNVGVFQALQSHPEWGTFFQTFSKDDMGELVMGQKFAEGGQAELYDVEIQWNDPWMNEDLLRLRKKMVLKVFKKGTSLQQLQLQWPRGLLQNHVEKMELGLCNDFALPTNTSDVCLGILLEDGRFAFLIVKEHEDLRHQIDRLMLKRSTNWCPYSRNGAEGIMYNVALGMEWLHSHGIVHRDLKASNVLCTRLETGWSVSVADFECSVGVIGTGFFRAPEILQACKDYSISDKPELFTKEADVYSYGMVCYEILTWSLPFEDYSRGDFDHVLVGERPKVPEGVDGWLQDLLRMCWQSNPIDRPSFRVILEILFNNSEICRKILAQRRKSELERAKGRRNEAARMAI